MEFFDEGTAEGVAGGAVGCEACAFSASSKLGCLENFRVFLILYFAFLCMTKFNKMDRSLEFNAHLLWDEYKKFKLRHN